MICMMSTNTTQNCIIRNILASDIKAQFHYIEQLEKMDIICSHFFAHRNKIKHEEILSPGMQGSAAVCYGKQARNHVPWESPSQPLP